MQATVWSPLCGAALRAITASRSGRFRLATHELPAAPEHSGPRGDEADRDHEPPHAVAKPLEARRQASAIVRTHRGPGVAPTAARARPWSIVARNLETWLAERSLGEESVAAYVEAELRAYLRCGILSFGFARARCGTCARDFLVAFSCKGRGVCPSCNGRRMAQTAAHLVDHVIPPVPVRQWVSPVPKRLRWFLARGAQPEAVAALTRIFISEVERLVHEAAGVALLPTAGDAQPPRIGGVAFLPARPITPGDPPPILPQFCGENPRATGAPSVARQARARSATLRNQPAAVTTLPKR